MNRVTATNAYSCQQPKRIQLILSKAHRFIFIKGVKVGGTSVEIALSDLCGPNDIITPITPIDELRRLGSNGRARNYSDNPKQEREYLDILRRATVSDLGKLNPPISAYFNHMSLRQVLQLQGPSVLDYRIVLRRKKSVRKDHIMGEPSVMLRHISGRRRNACGLDRY